MSYGTTFLLLGQDTGHAKFIGRKLYFGSHFSHNQLVPRQDNMAETHGRGELLVVWGPGSRELE